MDRIELSEPPVVLRRGDGAWPTSLDDLADPPLAVRVAGRVPGLDHAVAIVGTRFADADALAFTRRLAATLAASGLTVVSGGALGVDAAAHEGALSVGGATVAVLATGFLRPYPRSHGGLFSAIAETGALLCESDDCDRPPQGAFLRRNRLIAALAPTLVVTQAPVRSGALTTAAIAKRLNRLVFAVPSAPWDPRGEGCVGLLRRGARICTSAADVLSVRASKPGQPVLPIGAGAGTSSGRRAKKVNDDNGLPDTARRVWRALGRGRRHLDELCNDLDMTAGQLQEALLTLVLAGLATQAADGTYQRVLD